MRFAQRFQIQLIVSKSTSKCLDLTSIQVWFETGLLLKSAQNAEITTWNFSKRSSSLVSTKFLSCNIIQAWKTILYQFELFETCSCLKTSRNYQYKHGGNILLLRMCKTGIPFCFYILNLRPFAYKGWVPFTIDAFKVWASF